MSEPQLSSAAPATRRPVVAWIDLGAFEHNVALLARLVAPSDLCVVVKANAYGHGALEIAAAALRAGASLVATAFIDEAIALRAAGLQGRILVLVEPDVAKIDEALEYDLELTCYHEETVLAAEAASAARSQVLGLHLKLDTGMHRLGADHATLLALARRVSGAEWLELEGLCTHFAVADEPDDPFTGVQLARLLEVRDELRHESIDARRVHAANSAGAIAHPGARLDLVRVGIASYGLLPSPALAATLESQLPPGEALRPVMSLVALVHHVQHLAPGERTSYGQHYEITRPSTLVTVPIGYADGVPRLLGERGGEVLIGGRRRPIAGTVTMDQLIVDCGDDPVRIGDEVVLLGRQGGEVIDAWEWAQRTGTIAYEVVCGISTRVPRRLR